MSRFRSVFSEDIVLDEDAFDAAIVDFSALSQRMKALRTTVEEMITTLRAGFDTPAGRKFIDSCEKNLFQPLDAQEVVLKHISETLSQSKQAYESVFEEYEALQAVIRQVDQA